jgi:hypothetical protein
MLMPAFSLCTAIFADKRSISPTMTPTTAVGRRTEVKKRAAMMWRTVKPITQYPVPLSP